MRKSTVKQHESETNASATCSCQTTSQVFKDVLTYHICFFHIPARYSFSDKPMKVLASIVLTPSRHKEATGIW